MSESAWKWRKCLYGPKIPTYKYHPNNVPPRHNSNIWSISCFLFPLSSYLWWWVTHISSVHHHKITSSDPPSDCLPPRTLSHNSFPHPQETQGWPFRPGWCRGWGRWVLLLLKSNLKFIKLYLHSIWIVISKVIEENCAIFLNNST